MQVTFADILAHNSRHFPHKHAVTIDQRALTYGALAQRVEAVRSLLTEHVGPGDRVAIWLPNSFAWIATFLAVASLRAASVPVNTRLTIPELNVILHAASVRVLVTTRVPYRGRNYLDEVQSSGGVECATTIDASDELAPTQWPVWTRRSAAQDTEPIGRDDLFCIQYTSGTTSTPKGVMLSEQMYLQTAAYCARCQVLTPSSSFMSAAPFFHCSGSMHALSVCLVAGCTLHTMSGWDVELFLRLVQKYAGDTGHGAFLRDIAAYGTDKARPYLATLKTVSASGTPNYLRSLHDELGVTGVANLYGMTETCGNFTMWYPDDPFVKRISANGRPQAGNRIRIADHETGTVHALGRIGEIQLRGHTVTRGYFRRPDATSSAFTHDGWFRSGDLGALSAEGELSYIARLKEIVRVGGENVSPVEVEEVIREVSGVRQVCVLALPDQRLGEVAAAVVICDAPIAWHAVIQEMKSRLAGFKIPREIYVADVFPMTTTNKVQRSVLKEQITAGRLRRVL